MTAVAPEYGMRALLSADPTVRAIVGERGYPQRLPLNPTLPAYTYQRISTTRSHIHAGPATNASARIQLTLWGRSERETRALADATAAVLDGYTGTVLLEDDEGQAVVIGSLLLANEVANFEPRTELHQISQDYLAWHVIGG
jgi:hypothetical protein